jgi:hypothetical protein
VDAGPRLRDVAAGLAAPTRGRRGGEPVTRARRTNERTERLVALFLLGLLLFGSPLVAPFNAPRLVLGVPLLYLYLFVAWAAVILLAGIVVHRADGP